MRRDLVVIGIGVLLLMGCGRGVADRRADVHDPLGLERQTREQHPYATPPAPGAWSAPPDLGASATTATAVRIQTQDGPEAFIIRIMSPDIVPEQFDIRVDESGVHIRGQVQQVEEKRDASGRVVGRSASQSSVSQDLSLPPYTDHRTAKIENRKDEILIILPKAAHSAT